MQCAQATGSLHFAAVSSSLVLCQHRSDRWRPELAPLSPAYELQCRHLRGTMPLKIYSYRQNIRVPCCDYRVFAPAVLSQMSLKLNES